MKYIKGAIAFTILVLILSDCEKEQFIRDGGAKLGFSADTVFFDTVFSTIGTTTQIFKVYNRHNKNIEISEIYLAGGNNSVFRLNIDGEPTRRIKNKKIGPRDSLFIFVEATVSPNGDNNPMVIKDSVVFVTNNNYQDVKLMAWGQDMHYYRSEIIKSETWNNDKPYLIYNVLVVDSNEVLTINPGVQVYLHWNTSLIVWGSLVVNGTADEPVVFQGDRLESEYDFDPGQWGTIAMVEGSKGNIINHAIIKNAIVGLWLGHDTVYRKSEAKVMNTTIINTSGTGILSFGSDLEMYNTVIGKTGQGNVLAWLGGNLNFYHCTFHNPSSEYPSVLLTNYTEYQRSGSDVVYSVKNELVQANFYNAVLWGNNKNDSELLFLDNKESGFNYKFDHCLLRVDVDSFDIENENYFTGNILNENPKLVIDPSYKYDLEKDYMLDTLSPAKDKAGKVIINLKPELVNDIREKSRMKDGLPDIGAFERFENE